MNIPRKIMLASVVTLGVFALGSAGAAVAHTFTIEDRTGEVQNIAPVMTGTTSPSPSESPDGDGLEDPTDATSPSPSASPEAAESVTPTGAASPSPSASTHSDELENPTNTTTVAPAPPVNIDENDSSADNKRGSGD